MTQRGMMRHDWVENGLGERGGGQTFERRKTVWGCQKSDTSQTVLRRLSTVTDTTICLTPLTNRVTTFDRRHLSDTPQAVLRHTVWEVSETFWVLTHPKTFFMDMLDVRSACVRCVSVMLCVFSRSWRPRTDLGSSSCPGSTTRHRLVGRCVVVEAPLLQVVCVLGGQR